MHSGNRSELSLWDEIIPFAHSVACRFNYQTTQKSLNRYQSREKRLTKVQIRSEQEEKKKKAEKNQRRKKEECKREFIFAASTIDRRI